MPATKKSEAAKESSKSRLCIGVLALQGDIEEHLAALRACKVEAVPVGFVQCHSAGLHPIIECSRCSVRPLQVLASLAILRRTQPSRKAKVTGQSTSLA